MKLKELLQGRKKLKEYDELSKWKDYFSRVDNRLSLRMSQQEGEESGWDKYAMAAFPGLEIPDRIKETITNALEAEIAKLDEE